MTRQRHRDIEFAIEVFVRGHSAGRSRTFPYEASRVGPVWVMRDAPRKNPRDYRKEEWIAHGVEPAEVNAIARKHTRGRFFVCVIVREGDTDAPTRSAYKALGYRLLATEGVFVQRLQRIPNSASPVAIERVRTPVSPRGSARRRARGRSPTICSAMMHRSASTWRSRTTTS